MSIFELSAKVNELRELRRMSDEIAAEIDAIQDEIKKHMTAANVDTLAGTDFKITWKPVTASRFDTVAFKRENPELSARYTRTTTSRRFTIA